MTPSQRTFGDVGARKRAGVAAEYLASPRAEDKRPHRPNRGDHRGRQRRVDVSDAEAMTRFADATIARFGR
ncbi:hypothetical protein I546_6979 [Mycobacterium kansasii 732]|nr:hypothetical protein I546_6979 [Mycobacterium kansasii 732]